MTLIKIYFNTVISVMRTNEMIQREVEPRPQNDLNHLVT